MIAGSSRQHAHSRNEVSKKPSGLTREKLYRVGIFLFGSVVLFLLTRMFFLLLNYQLAMLAKDDLLELFSYQLFRELFLYEYFAAPYMIYIALAPVYSGAGRIKLLRPALFAALYSLFFGIVAVKIFWHELFPQQAIPEILTQIQTELAEPLQSVVYQHPVWTLALLLIPPSLFFIGLSSANNSDGQNANLRLYAFSLVVSILALSGLALTYFYLLSIGIN